MSESSINAPSPATNVVAALDTPFRIAKERFGEYAPTIGVCTLLGAIPNVAQQFLVQEFQGAMSANDPAALLSSLPLMYVGPCLGALGMAVGYALEASCVANVLAGRGGGLGEALRPVASGRFWLGYTLAAVFSGIGYACCCFGGFILLLPFGLMLPALLVEQQGVAALSRSVDLSLQRTGPGFFDRPGWKVVAAMAASMAVAMAFGQAAALPVYISMGSAFFDAIRSGHPELLQQGGVNPWAGTATVLMNAGVRIFTDTYGLMAVFLIFADARKRLGGADLARAIEETPRG